MVHLQNNVGIKKLIFFFNQENLTTKTLWKRITEDDDSIKAVRSMNHMRNTLLENVLRKGKAIRATSEEFPQYKKSGKIFPLKKRLENNSKSRFQKLLPIAISHVKPYTYHTT